MQFRITYADGRTEELKAVPSALLAYEQEFDRPAVAEMSTGRNHWAYWLCWKTKTVRENESRSFEDWLTLCDDIVIALPFRAEIRAIANRCGPRKLPSGDEVSVDPWLHERLVALLEEWDAEEDPAAVDPPDGGTATD
jgi:hypothetical protein